MLKYVVIISFMICLACGRSTPLDFKPGEFSCEHCRMSIVQMGFKAEAITNKGKIYRFDSIECLLTWNKSHQDSRSSLWVTNYFNSSQWLHLEQAYFLKSKNLISPMGGFLSAYASQEDLWHATQQFGGEPISLENLNTFNLNGPGASPNGVSP